MRIRSPEYPSISLQKAVDIVDRIFRVSRQNSVDREAAAKDIGYSGLTGQSQKMLANLGHYGLVEKSGKGGIRVTDVAVKILHPKTSSEKREALNGAAYSPELFQEIKQSWPDGYVSENALRGHLLRAGFSTAAVGPAISSYTETYGFLQQEGATESHGDPVASAQIAEAEAEEPAEIVEKRASAPAAVSITHASLAAPKAELARGGLTMAIGERELTTGILAKGASFRLIVHGKIGVREIERLIKKLEIDKEILAEVDDEACSEDAPSVS